MKEDEGEDTYMLRYTVYISAYGQKQKCIKDTGMTLAKMLHTAFGDNRVRIVDHRSRPIVFDPDRHDFGLGEA
jgi:hypothetical protein